MQVTERSNNKQDIIEPRHQVQNENGIKEAC